ncbi:MAG: transposase [Candidatus Saccharibacteria bacterium]|nr:transposase [Rhodoferax sp.]
MKRYRLKEAFYGIYQAKTVLDAMAQYETWCKSIPPELHDHFHDLTPAFQNWMPEILNYFDHPVTNAYTESLNSLIRVMDRMGWGYSFEALRAKILFTEGAHHKKRTRPKFDRQRDGGARFSIPDDAAVMNDQLFILSKSFMISSPANQHDLAGEVLNYGASISTLVKLFEDGELRCFINNEIRIPLYSLTPPLADAAFGIAAHQIKSSKTPCKGSLSHSSH